MTLPAMTHSTAVFYSLELVSALHDGYRKVFCINAEDLLLIQHEGQVYLLNNICPHAAYPLHEGQIIASDLRCPMHGYLFDLASGVCTYYTEGPCKNLRIYAVIKRQGYVGVLL